MKKMTLIRSIATAALFLVAGMGAFAQVTGVGTPNDATDYDTVTVNSVMPYRVSGDLNMHSLRALGILNYSQFTKAVSAGGTIRAASGASGSTPAATDSAFSVAWGGTAGSQTVQVTEVPVVVSGPAFSCTANTQTLNVILVNRPTVAWNGSPSATGCGVAGTTVTIPYTVTGTGRYDVTYRITYTSLTGATSNVVPTGTLLNGLGSYQTGSANLNFSYSVPATTYGRYDVYVENVTDRISRKSGITTSLAADLPAAATFYSYPTPATQPVQHIQNL